MAPPTLATPLCPSSCWNGFLHVRQTPDGRLGVSLLVSGLAVHKHRGEREQWRMEVPWQEIRERRGEESAGKRGPDEGHPDYDAWWAKWNYLEDLDEPSYSVWPENKRCLQHIITRLRSVFPGRVSFIDEQLRDKE